LEKFGLAKCRRAFDLIVEVAGEKLVMTNSPAAFARRILTELNCFNFFSGIYGIQEMNFVEKPSRAAFSVLHPHLSCGKRVVFVDDKAENIEVAEKLGCIGVLWEQITPDGLEGGRRESC
jgi:FMN phosphatase YigB (HAD superfamily)